MNYANARFPLVEPFATHRLAVSDLHTLYVEEIGNPKGLPVIFLHGGPGAGIFAGYRRFFDPALFHVILFAQRGANPSTPLGEIRENDTWTLVEDIETIRSFFNIEQWIVFGGSWGSTLALTYALKHPEHVSGMVLRGIFLGLQWELDWLYREGASHFFPEGWREFVSLIPMAERDDLIAAYHRRIFDADPAVHLPAAWSWVLWEDKIGTLLPAAEPTPFTDESALAMAKIECHFMFKHLFFEKDDYLLKETHRLAGIPCHIVQGRYDMICPAESAFALAKELPQAVLHLVPDAGHSSSEPGTASELIASMQDLYINLSTQEN
jgi:proline iminopeptidase